MTRRLLVVAGLLLLCGVPTFLALAHIGGAHWLAFPVSEDPGISWMVLSETPTYRILRDFAEPGATRRMHHHADASWHILTLATGHLVLTVEGEVPIDVTPGHSLSIKGGVMHTFKNVGTETATIIEVFGKPPPQPRP